MKHSIFNFLQTLSSQDLHDFMKILSKEERQSLLTNFYFSTAHPHQIPPADQTDYSYWLILGGRGSGKTRAGAEYILQQVKQGIKHIALIGENIGDVIDIMVMGVSGIMACARASQDKQAINWIPTLQKADNCLSWANGAKASFFSAKYPESLRGYQFELAWCDELIKWRSPQATWDNLLLAMRLGKKPRVVVTTTPRPLKLLKDLINNPQTYLSKASTFDNQKYLAKSFFEKIITDYDNTRLGRQELHGDMIDSIDGALWHKEMIDKYRIAVNTRLPHFVRLVIAVDPPVSEGKNADECGIIVAGMDYVIKNDKRQSHAYILADCSLRGVSPYVWAKKVTEVFYQYKVDIVVAEVNQGGSMVRELIHNIDSNIAYKEVRATRGKIVRAEPIAALYEQGRVHHIGEFPFLEEQLCCFTPFGILRNHAKSPDRADALIWAVTELILSAPEMEPHIRGLD